MGGWCMNRVAVCCIFITRGCPTPSIIHGGGVRPGPMPAGASWSLPSICGVRCSRGGGIWTWGGGRARPGRRWKRSSQSCKGVRPVWTREAIVERLHRGVDPYADVVVDQCELLSETPRSEEHTSELQSRESLVCRLLLERQNAREAVDLSTQHP